MSKSMRRILTVLSVLFVCMAGNAQKHATLYNEYLKNRHTSVLQDFSYAGYRYNEVNIPEQKNQIDVTTLGILPDTGKDLTDRVQALIDETGESGGGVLYFPKGRYCFNMDTTRVQYLKIDYSNIVIRGDNATENGTVFYSGANTLQEHRNPWISPFLIRFGNKIQSPELFWGVLPLKPGPEGSEETVIHKAEIITTITTNAKRGETRLKLADASKVKPGDVVLIAMYNTSDDGNLLQELLNYNASEITPDMGNARLAGIKQVASFQWLVEVKTVKNNNTIVLCQPLRCDISTKYKPAIAAAPMLREVGIDNIRFESAWDGEYFHHGSNIMNYGWNAVNFCRVAHGWMRNVVIDNYTNPVYLQDSRNITLDNITITGPHGHSGIKIYAHAADNLVKNVRFKNNFTHIISGEGNAYGNVFTGIKYEIPDSIPGRFDFHGWANITYSPPAWNLIELMDGVTRIDGGGSPRNFPHTAKHNVWWNCTAGGLSKPSELFTHWVWKKGNRTDHHVMYPVSIIVGYSAHNHKLLINGCDKDRIERLIIVESLNKSVYPASLFEAQLKQRIYEKASFNDN